MTREMLLKKSLDDLREIARTLGAKAVTKYRKAELADIIMAGGRLPSPSESAAAPAKDAAVKQDDNLSPAVPEAEPQGAPSAPQTPEVDYAPRKRGRPKKAINDPSPTKPSEKDAPEAESLPAKQAEDRRYRNYQRNRADRADHRQQNQQRHPAQNRSYYERNDYARQEQTRGFQSQRAAQDFRQQELTPESARNEALSHYGWAEDDPRLRAGREGYYNPEYGTSNPAVPELLEGGECGDAEGILEIVSDGYGFLRCDNFTSGPNDVYVSNAQIRRFRLKTGDRVTGKTRPSRDNDRYMALLYITAVNGCPPEQISRRPSFEELVPIFPDERLTLDYPGAKRGERLAIRLVDLMAPIGKGQRGLIVSQPKAGKTTLLKNIANGVSNNYPDVKLIVLLIDERPEEVTDMQRSIKGEVVYSTFDELPERHTRIAEMVLEHAMRLVEQGRDVVILLDSITRLARAYNLTITPTGRTLSGGMDPGALYKPKRFFGAARNIENGGSLTVIATALVETGSRMDDMVYEEFKGTGNMEIHLDRKLSERRIFPAVDVYKSGTRRDELLLSQSEAECAASIRRMLATGNAAEVTEQVIELLNKTETTEELIAEVGRVMGAYGDKGFTAGRTVMRHY